MRGKQTTKIVNVCGRNTQEISVLCTVNNSKYHSTPFPVHLKTTLKTRLGFRSNKGSRRQLPRGPNTSWKEVSMLIRGAAIVLNLDCLIIKLNKLLQTSCWLCVWCRATGSYIMGLTSKKSEQEFYILSSKIL